MLFYNCHSFYYYCPHNFFSPIISSQSPIRGSGLTIRTSSALHLNVSGALFIVLEDVIRMVKQTEKTKKLKAMIEKETQKEKEREREREREKEREKDNEKGREQEKLRKISSLTHCKSMELTENPLHSSKSKKGSLDQHFPTVDSQDDREKEAEIERALFEQARGRRKSINQRFRSTSCEDEEQTYDLEVSTKSESLTYASFNRRKAAHNASYSNGFLPVQVPDTSIGMCVRVCMCACMCVCLYVLLLSSSLLNLIS